MFFFAVILSRQSSFYLGAAAAASSSFPRSHFTTDPEDCLGFPRASDLHPRDQSPPLSSLLSLVLFYFPSFLKIYLSLELVVENMKRLRSGECWALVDKSSRIRGVKVLERERKNGFITVFRPLSLILFFQFLSFRSRPSLSSAIPLISHQLQFSCITGYASARFQLRAVNARNVHCTSTVPFSIYYLAKIIRPENFGQSLLSRIG